MSEGQKMIDIDFVNSTGGGFAGMLKVAEATPLEKFVADQTNGMNATQFRIRVNGNPAVASYILKDGDRVSVTPLKVAGAKTVFRWFMSLFGF